MLWETCDKEKWAKTLRLPLTMCSLGLMKSQVLSDIDGIKIKSRLNEIRSELDFSDKAVMSQL